MNEEPDGGGGDDVHGAQGEDAAEDAEDAEGVRDGHDARAFASALRTVLHALTAHV